jgi:hypothetical protein
MSHVTEKTGKVSKAEFLWLQSATDTFSRCDSHSERTKMCTFSQVDRQRVNCTQQVNFFVPSLAIFSLIDLYIVPYIATV